ncbi:endonuclease/exonuclease/phosphatase family protein [Levilactobacillus lindianensis]|uniref:endonuclease/exonuclease/phosphatase family protein n=1 Tax=Levilactobacillus lindianensis TaxID=2486018 RepID=UPI000F748A36|nr:endonuclease/exonuclease/phosphatase family protein [Levilactobacillus lindianensis]
MKNYDTLKILEWNINQRSSGKKIPAYVATEILAKKPDVIVLVEFKGYNNARWLTSQLSNYFTQYYDSVPDSSGYNTGQGIFVGLISSKFKKPTKYDVSYATAQIQPNWLKIHSTLKDNQKLDIIGVRIQVDDSSLSGLRGRKEEIKWLLEQNKDCERQFIVGDWNFGPHRTDYVPEYKINWQDIIYLIRDLGYLKTDYSPYSPNGTSFKNFRLDWLVTKGVSVNTSSEYNKLDWGFAQNNSKNYINGYMIPEGYFVADTPPYPDHAIFTAEINL